MENAHTYLLKRNIEMASNVIEASRNAKTEEKSPPTKVLVRDLIRGEAVRMVSLELGFPETRNIFDLEPEDRVLADAVAVAFVYSIADAYYPDHALNTPLELANVPVDDMAQFIRMLEHHRESLRKKLLDVQCIDTQVPVADVYRKSCPIIYIDSLAAFAQDYSKLEARVAASGIIITGTSTRRLSSGAGALAEITRAENAFGRDVLIIKGANTSRYRTKIEHECSMIMDSVPATPKNLRAGPALRGKRGKIRKW